MTTMLGQPPAPAPPAGAYAVSGAVLDHATGQPLEVRRAFANVAASQTDATFTTFNPNGTTRTLTAVAGKKLRVLAVVGLTGGTATQITFNSKGAGAGTAIGPDLANGPNGGEVLPMNPHGWLETKRGETLTLSTGAGATTGLLVLYVEVPG